MHLTLTKEVGWETDDDGDSSKSGSSVKRYHLILDFSWRSSRASRGRGRKRTAPRLESEKRRDEQRRGSVGPNRHACYGCGKTRCSDYHAQYPLKRGKEPIPSLCTACRYNRKARIADLARGGKRRRHRTRREARIDDWQWCANCGTLRSDEYHDMYLSGTNLPPWAEVCGKCMIITEKKMEKQKLRMYYDELDTEHQTTNEKRDPIRDSLHQRRSSPYALKPVCPRVEIEYISVPTSTPDLPAKTDPSNGPKSGEQLPLATGHPENAASSLSVGKAPERAHVQSNTCQATVKRDMSGESRKPANNKERQAIRQPESLSKTDSTRHPRQPEKRREQHEQPSKKPQPGETAVSGPTPATAARDSKERKEDRQRQRPATGTTQKSKPPSSSSFTAKPPKPQQFQPPHHHHQQQEEEEKARRPMGISDMYWASAEGQAEQAFAAAAGGYYFCPFFPGAGAAEPEFEASASAGGAFRPCGSMYSGDLSSGGDEQEQAAEYWRARPSDQGHGFEPRFEQVWEVDSDEEEEIERGRAKLFAGKVRGHA
ncbi:5c3ecdde-98fb-4389-ac97-e3945165fdb8 [Thermothielavioides terrestris]|uniref:5c3ecdde-98fb-4389-ac97-e3945165fdb8 n=1 Tax=Thermothielavioides terrestris TaxID=2587410 RepID=A0A3S4AJE2_9PEZI|nr:5c3ecdde-98fb-4389-ac97-e3945165fdb8 [Thermothielavioides terrestris]